MSTVLLRSIRKSFGVFVLVAMCGCAPRSAETSLSRTPKEIDSEATRIVAAAQSQLKQLPESQQRVILGALQERLSRSTSTLVRRDAAALMNTDPTMMTLIQKNDLLGELQRTQQLVDPSLMPTPVATVNADEIIASLRVSAPVSASEADKLRQMLIGLPKAAKSVGRLLWAEPSSNVWHLVGSVFVTQKNVVTTACHVIEAVSDVTGGKMTFRSDRNLVVDFSEGDVPKTGPPGGGFAVYPVKKVLAIAEAKGCDVAVLQIDNADGIAPLQLSTSTTTKRVAVIGYPQLGDLSSYKCEYAIDPTILYFCKFRVARPGIAKVGSPGNVFPINLHDGVIAYSSSTLTGQSGSPVLDLDTLNVVGVHYCCNGAPAEESPVACATWHPQNVKWNEAISSKTIMSDPVLKQYFQVAP